MVNKKEAWEKKAAAKSKSSSVVTKKVASKTTAKAAKPAKAVAKKETKAVEKAPAKVAKKATPIKASASELPPHLQEIFKVTIKRMEEFILQLLEVMENFLIFWSYKRKDTMIL